MPDPFAAWCKRQAITTAAEYARYRLVAAVRQLEAK